MKVLARLLLGAMFMGTALVAAPAANANTGGDSQGCTPGYWKQAHHFDSWQEAAPTDLFTDKFAIASPPAVLKKLTMLKALQGGGGSGVDGARLILARAATAAWLNAAYDSGDGSAMLFPWRRMTASGFDRPALVATVRAAITGTSRSEMLSLASRLDADNNLGCPLS
jgi:hypothetical protein